MSTPSTRPVALLGGRYRLGQLIGRGGMAEVYRATDQRLGREVAVKLFRPGVAAVEDLRRVRSEIRTLAALAHRGLVTLHDAADGDDGTPAYLVLELVRGSDLGALIRTRALTAAESIALVGEIAEALAYIHSRGIVHRDIKPENVLVARGEDGALHAKLADLGIARILGDSRLTEAGAVIGTAAYLSPEQVMGEEVGTSADVYALGLVLLEALTGRACFEGGKLEQALARVNRDVEIPDWIDDEDAALIEAMTSRDPDERPLARELVGELREWSSGEPPWTGEERQTFADGTEVLAIHREPTVTDPTEVFGTAHPDHGADEDSRTRVLGAPEESDASPTEAFGRPADPTMIIPVEESLAGAHPTDDVRTRVLGGRDDQVRTELLGAVGTESDPRPSEAGGWQQPPLQPLPSDPKAEKRRLRDERRRRGWRRVTVAVIILALLSGATIAAWPVLQTLVSPARPGAPAYPAVTGELADSIAALQTSADGDGFAYDAQVTIQSDVLAVSDAAAADDLEAASTALDRVATDLDLAATSDQVTSSRYRDMRTSIDLVRADIEAAEAAAAEAAAEAERQRQAEEQARLEEERQRQEELERQEQERLEQEQAEQEGGVGRTLDEIGQGIRDQIDEWFGSGQ
ncbi:MAG: serine/threonine-protein kinase [Naasia sp.]